MITVIQWIGMFLLGVRDSISIEWITKTLLYIDPKTKRVHPSSKKLFESLKSSLIKILLYVILVPTILEYFNFLSISTLLKIVYLILTYGYLFFLNNDIMVSTRKLIYWQEKRGLQLQQKGNLRKSLPNKSSSKLANNTSIISQPQNFSKNIRHSYNNTSQFNYSNDNINFNKTDQNNKIINKYSGNFQLDKNQRIQFFTLLSSQVKSFIFLLFYYLPIFIIQIKFLSFIPYFGMIILIISQSFFNGVFYFLKTWPFDQYNIGFLQKQMPYMMGYGFFVSLVCNYLLKGSFATAGYLIISLWMLINSVLYSPPEIQFKSFDQIIQVLLDSKKRNSLKNGYNVHRDQIRKNKQYRQEIVKKIFMVYPALKITQIFNQKISCLMKGNSMSFQRKSQYYGSNNLQQIYQAQKPIKNQHSNNSLRDQHYSTDRLNKIVKNNSNDSTCSSINQTDHSAPEQFQQNRVIIQLSQEQQDKQQ